MIDTAGGSTNTGNLLQLANKVCSVINFCMSRARFNSIILQLHLAALASLRAEISELNTRLQSVTEERDILENALKKYQVR